jgi:hypothetical protein
MAMSDVFYKAAKAVDDKVPGAGVMLYNVAAASSTVVELAVVAGLSVFGPSAK